MSSQRTALGPRRVMCLGAASAAMRSRRALSPSVPCKIKFMVMEVVLVISQPGVDSPGSLHGQLFDGGLDLRDARGQVGHGGADLQLVLPMQLDMAVFLYQFDDAHRIDGRFGHELQGGCFAMHVYLDDTHGLCRDAQAVRL